MRPVRIPQDRVGVAIGAEGQTKAMLQRMCGMRIDIDKEGNVMVHDEAKDADPLLALKVCDVIRAIGRNFSRRGHAGSSRTTSTWRSQTSNRYRHEDQPA